MTPEQRDDIAERYDFAEGEQEAIARELAERRAAIQRDEVLQWCRERSEAKRESERAAEITSRGAQDRKPQRDGSAMTSDWAAFIDRRIRADRKASERNLLHAVADAIHNERQASRKAVDELRAAVTELRERLDKIEIERSSASLHTLRAVVSGN